jgi:hypothetical protein
MSEQDKWTKHAEFMNALRRGRSRRSRRPSATEPEGAVAFRDRAFHDLRGAPRPEIASTSLSILGASWPNATVPVGAARRVGSGDVHRVLSRERDPVRVAVALLGKRAGGVHAQAKQRHGAGCDRDYPPPQRRRLSWQPPREESTDRTSWLARGLPSPASGVYVSCLRRKLEAAGEPRLLHNVGGRRLCAPGGLVRLSRAPP